MPKKFYELEQYKSLPCVASLFNIKGKEASIYDFGNWTDGVDVSTLWEMPNGGCPDRVFKARTYKENSKAVKKYNLTKEEYDTLASVLEERFSIKHCDWCV